MRKGKLGLFAVMMLLVLGAMMAAEKKILAKTMDHHRGMLVQITAVH